MLFYVLGVNEELNEKKEFGRDEMNKKHKSPWDVTSADLCW